MRESPGQDRSIVRLSSRIALTLLGLALLAALLLLVSRREALYVRLYCRPVRILLSTGEGDAYGQWWRDANGNPRGPVEYWYVDTGIQYMEGTFGENGLRLTTWDVRGVVAAQVEHSFDPSTGTVDDDAWTSPPWKWNASDREGPDAPWLGRGIGAEEWLRELERE